MMSIQALREQRNTAAVALQALVNDTKPNEWGSDHQTKYDAMMTDIDNLDAAMDRMQTAIDRVGAHRDAIDGLADRRGVRRSEAEADEEKVVNTFTNFLRQGFKGMDIADIQAMQRQINAAQSVGTNTAGGYLVPVTTVAQILVELKAYGGMRSVATIIETASGETMNWPTIDDTGQTGELIAENTTATSQDMTFGTVGMTSYKFSSKIFAISFELLQDSVVDVVALVNKMAATRIGRSMNTYFTTGTGTSQPRGVVTAAASGKVGTTGQTLSVIYDDLVDLEHSIDPAFREMGCRWMMNDASLKVLKKIKDAQNRPLWLPGLSGIEGPISKPTLMGYPYTINQDVATMAANAKSILFGRFDFYLIRDIMQMILFRFDDSAYIKLGQIGFLMWARSGGNFIAPSSSSMKYYQNSAT
jgi:HK97 family phage major capsid protein